MHCPPRVPVSGQGPVVRGRSEHIGAWRWLRLCCPPWVRPKRGRCNACGEEMHRMRLPVRQIRCTRNAEFSFGHESSMKFSGVVIIRGSVVGVSITISMEANLLWLQKRLGRQQQQNVSSVMTNRHVDISIPFSVCLLT